MGWLSTRALVRQRDGNLCQVCLLPVGRMWDVGHLVDRCVGGDDTLSNLYLSCVHCNRRRKPIHRTRAEAGRWLEQERARARGLPLPDDWRPLWRALSGKEERTLVTVTGNRRDDGSA